MSQGESLKVFQDTGSFLVISLDIHKAHVYHLPDYLRPNETWEQTRKVTALCVGSANFSSEQEQRGRVCIGLAEGGGLTVNSKAGIGVQRFTWIMASTLGRWPSLAPAKNSLVKRKTGQPGVTYRLPKEVPSPAQSSLFMPTFCSHRSISPTQPRTHLPMHTPAHLSQDPHSQVQVQADQRQPVDNGWILGAWRPEVWSEWLGVTDDCDFTLWVSQRPNPFKNGPPPSSRNTGSLKHGD